MSDNKEYKYPIKHTAFNWFFTRRILRRINKNIEEIGFAKAFARVIDSVSKKMDVQRHPDAIKTLSEDPVLLITNHPAELDAMVLLSSLPTRKDVFMLINNSFISVLPAFDPHCIPVYVNYRTQGDERETMRAKVLKRIHYSPLLTLEESKVKNREAIGVSAKAIDDGGVILLAPGFGNNDTEFKIGLGYMLNAVSIPEKAKIIMTHISGTSKLDYFRAIPLLKKVLPRFRIIYSGPAELKKFVSGDPKVDTKSLQDYYFNWVNTEILPKLKNK
ncbi:MAG: hypothetical protein HOF35_16270 [Bacteroidetes bacterium]|jgi:hypothetical protein|nr:hypothetical protein [Bacteroidota bacterium]MBT3935810.1 hypothetical protein [Bacteroidota bacterium]MBT4728905.1 hypothetical protein [Bacteroidota bacterium]MBT5989916.1 hypothetical protein [Bacteroidota bacterium]MBT6835098.1 hypothetical protein [Bacteroidota bacterium]